MVTSKNLFLFLTTITFATITVAQLTAMTDFDAWTEKDCAGEILTYPDETSGCEQLNRAVFSIKLVTAADGCSLLAYDDQSCTGDGFSIVDADQCWNCPEDSGWQSIDISCS